MKFKKYFSDYYCPSFEKQYNSLLSKDKDDSDEVHPSGFNANLCIYTNNRHHLQERYQSEMDGREAIKKEVFYVDAAPFIFPKQKINYRFWKAHLKKNGSLIHHCNLEITELHLKLVLLKIFNKNVHIPNGKTINYWRLGIELDEVVEASIMNGIPKRNIQITNKILFNPTSELTGKERKSISAKLART